MDQINQIQAIPSKILHYIHIKKLDKGSLLPPERKFAAILSTSRNSIREALRILETRGIVEIKRGSGCYVKDLTDEWLYATDGKALPDQGLLVHQIEARLALEPRIVQLAIERIQKKELEHLEKTVIRLSAAFLARDLSSIITEDNRFRMIIAQCTRNPIISKMVKQLETSATGLWELITEFPKDNIDSIFAGYVKILQSIQNRDPENARKNIEAHILELFRLITNASSRKPLSVKSVFPEE